MLDYYIPNEDASVHWKYFNPKGKNVLDLGCGRWDASSAEEYSPIWIYNQGAIQVIGIDGDPREIEIMKEITSDKTDKFTFINDRIGMPDQVKDYIKKFNINAIKSDIEGAERVFIDGFSKEDFYCIDLFSVEYHGAELRDLLIQKIPTWGFTITVHGKLYAPNYGVLFCEK